MLEELRESWSGASVQIAKKLQLFCGRIGTALPGDCNFFSNMKITSSFFSMNYAKKIATIF